MSRKTYEKVANINGMFNMLEQQIVHSKDMALFRNEFFYFVMNSSMSIMSIENYEALLVYYKTVSIIQSSTALVILSPFLRFSIK